MRDDRLHLTQLREHVFGVEHLADEPAHVLAHVVGALLPVGAPPVPQPRVLLGKVPLQRAAQAGAAPIVPCHDLVVGIHHDA
ncbi:MULTISPECIES: hypothetical protein [Sorangium]|uniref:hypothetical protein n=1 Tax=Sorangium TaxID=39643 RepID=UPI001019FD74|nr:MULTISPECIES: hypothetical protein [Sorangium]